jgi:hypothetical protein
LGGASFWTQSGSAHNTDPAAHGRWGSGGGTGYTSQNTPSNYAGGSGVIVIYKYS